MAKQELIAHLPSDTTERKRLKGVIDEYVNALIQEAAAKDLMGSIKETEKDRGYDPAYIKQLGDLQYDALFNEKKKITKIEISAERVSELEILMDDK